MTEDGGEVSNNNKNKDNIQIPPMPAWAKNDPRIRSALRTFYLSGYWTGVAKGMAQK